MFRLILALVLAAAPLAANAQSEAEIRTQAQASMLVSGTIDIEPDGSVSSYALDRQEKLPGYVVDVIGKAAPGWRFEPVMVDGAPVSARARMTLRLLAVPADNEAFEISISSASFGARDSSDTDLVQSIRLTPPRYPFSAAKDYASGDVFLLLRISPAGRVVETTVEQVNLRSAANGRNMQRLQKAFSEAAVTAARNWVWRPPSTGDDAGASFWTVRIPVSFLMEGTAPSNEYDKWIGYVPGPRQQAPWLDGADSGANDALASGTFQQVGTGPRLLTPLQPES